MPWGSIAIILSVIIFIAVMTAMKKVSQSRCQSFPYKKKDTLLTKAERSFLGILEQAVGDQYRIHAQVRLADLMAVNHGVGRSARVSAQNRINCKHADFVLCHKDTLEIICALELDDASHQRAQRQERDDFVEKACNAAGLPLARFSVKGLYSIPGVKTTIEQMIGAQHRSGAADAANALPMNSPLSQTDPLTDEVPVCPKCGSRTALKTVRRGAYAGKKLWRCENYPACRGFIAPNP